jgi:hypothetical protein
MAKVLQTETPRANQDNVPTVRPPRPSFRLDAAYSDPSTPPVSNSLSQLAEEVRKAEAELERWSIRR